MSADNHSEIDQYAKGSTLGQFDPRIKIASTIALVVAIAFLKGLEPLLICLAFLLFLIALSKVPIAHFGRNFALALPFILFPALVLYFTSGPLPAVAMALRISSSVIALLLLVTTTPFFDLLKGLRWFRIPHLISSMLLFTYRFIFVLLDETRRMKLARKARGFTGRGNLFSKDVFQTISFTAGMVLVRSNNRAGRIYDALLSRGFTGEVHTLHNPKVRKRDAAYAISFLLIAFVAIMLQFGVVTWTL
jgi:cobalt/nickel transport system permease protein